MRDISFSFVKAGRVQPDDIIDEWERPRFGFYWWFWIPYYHSNGGRFRRGECVDMNLKWFCYSVGVIIWNNPKLFHKMQEKGIIQEFAEHDTNKECWCEPEEVSDGVWVHKDRH